MRITRFILVLMVAWSTAPTTGPAGAESRRAPQAPRCCCGNRAIQCSCGCSHGPAGQRPANEPDRSGLSLCSCIQPLAVVPPVVELPRTPVADWLTAPADGAEPQLAAPATSTVALELLQHPPELERLETVLILI